MKAESYITLAKRVINIEIQALQQLRDELDDGFNQTVDLIRVCKGRVIITGVGKSGHIARKISSTMASLGTSSFYMHPNEAMHGDLGVITSEDVILAISNSGESDEILRIIPNIKLIGATLVAITSNMDSNLARYGDIVCKVPKVEEACILDMAPTSSSAVALALGDALAIVLSDVNDFKRENYAVLHPAGSLGKKLTTKVSDVMHAGVENPVVLLGSTLKQAIVEISKKGLGAVGIVDTVGRLRGILTDGDIRRSMDKDVNIYECKVDEVMTKSPITILGSSLAIDALMMMQSGGKKASVLPVVDDGGFAIGLINASDILKLGIVY